MKKKKWILLLSVVLIAALLIIEFYSRNKPTASVDKPFKVLNEQTTSKPMPNFTTEMRGGKFALRFGTDQLTPFEYDSINISTLYPILYKSAKEIYIFNKKKPIRFRLAGPFIMVKTINSTDSTFFQVGVGNNMSGFYNPISGDTTLFNYPLTEKVKGFTGFYWVYTKSGEKGIISRLEYKGFVLPLNYYIYVNLKKDFTPEGNCIGTSERDRFYIQYYTKTSWGLSFTQIGGEMSSATPRVCRNEIKDKKIGDLFGFKTDIAVVCKNGFAILKSESGYGLINNGAKLVVPLKYQQYQMVNDSLCYFYLDGSALKVKLKTAPSGYLVGELRREGSYKQ